MDSLIVLTLITALSVPCDSVAIESLESHEKTLIGLTLADIVTTGYIISTGGTELNPLLPKDNIPAIAIIKTAIVIGYLNTNPSKKEIWLMNIITSTAVINNFYQIVKHSR